MVLLHPEGLAVLAEAAFRSLLVAAVVGLGLAAFRVRSVPAQKTAWTLVLAGAIIMPFTSSWIGKLPWLANRARIVVPLRPWRQFLPTEASSANQPVLVSSQATSTFAASIPVKPAHPERSSSHAASAASQADRFPAPAISTRQLDSSPSTSVSVLHNYRPLTLPEIAFLGYLAVAAVLTGRFLYGLLSALRMWSSAEPVIIGAAAGPWPGVPVRSSRAVTTPLTIGSGIVLPADYVEWDTAKLRIVLAHEAAHVWQGDFYLHLCASAYAAIVWFSPLGWWTKRKLCDLSEALSDAAAVQHACSHASYAQILLEFAAMPRTANVGVAMARSGRLSQRIERLLNESSFRQAFAHAHGRSIAAAVLAASAMFASATLIRVQAAQETPAAPPARAVPPRPVPPKAPETAMAPQTPQAPSQEELPPAPPPRFDLAVPTVVKVSPDALFALANTQSDSNSSRDRAESDRHNHRYWFSGDGDSYALVRGNDHVSFSGSWMEGSQEEFEKARQKARGDFLWFTRGGRSYFVDDPAILNQIEAMYKPIEELGRRQEELGRQQEELGQQQEKLGEQMNGARISSPDLSKEIAALNEAAAKLQQAKDRMISQDQLSELQERLADLQNKIGNMQGQIGDKQSELGDQQGKLGEQQGRLGEQQGRLGAEQGRLAAETDRKVKSIIDESLKNGKAQPVE